MFSLFHRLFLRRFCEKFVKKNAKKIGKRPANLASETLKMSKNTLTGMIDQIKIQEAHKFSPVSSEDVEKYIMVRDKIDS